MPENNENNGGAGGDDAAAKAAADKAAADAAAAAEAKAKADAGGEETITIKKSELKKIEEDRDNYKKIGLQKKADEREFKGAGGGQGEGQGGSAVIDEKKVGEVASAAVTKTLRAASEKTARRAFLTAHPEYADDAQWTALVSHLTFRGTEMTHDEVADRMEAALLEHKRSTGKLSEHLQSEHERGVREGRIQGEIGSGHGTGGAGDKNEGAGSGNLSPSGEYMARVMHVDPKKVAKVDPKKDNVINVV